jgi:hypothetical protein
VFDGGWHAWHDFGEGGEDDGHGGVEGGCAEAGDQQGGCTRLVLVEVGCLVDLVGDEGLEAAAVELFVDTGLLFGGEGRVEGVADGEVVDVCAASSGLGCGIAGAGNEELQAGDSDDDRDQACHWLGCAGGEVDGVAGEELVHEGLR